MRVRPSVASWWLTHRRQITTTCLASAVALGGCGAPKLHKPAVDAPWPGAIASTTVPWCHLAQGLRQLAPGDSCRLVVQAALWLNASGVQVCPQQKYELAIAPDQYWVDATRRSHPLHGDPGNWFMNLFAATKRVPEAPWFLVVAGVRTTGSDAPKEPALQALASLPPTSTEHRAQFASYSHGELVLAANDAKVPWMEDSSYGNNHGRVLATLSLQTASPRCT